jgi:hypothetical protein
LFNVLSISAWAWKMSWLVLLLKWREKPTLIRKYEDATVRVATKLLNDNIVLYYLNTMIVVLMNL